MPYRQTPLVTGEYYHIYNRGVAYQPTFKFKMDFERFILCLSYYKFNETPVKLSRLLQIPLEDRNKIIQSLEKEDNRGIEIIAFVLMPNHFHLLIKQVSDGAISRFMKKITDSYTKYFNTKSQRVGPVFQGAFKVVHVDNDEQLIHLSRYIHLNPLVSHVVREEDFLDYKWSSLQEYLNEESTIVNSKLILDFFKSKNIYLKFILDQKDYGEKLEQLKHLTMEK